jgi:peptidyl-prolyl cis-trans isomerase SurA
LLREYEEGILLFEVKKQLIWDKASSDEEGLTKFYNANKGKYQWRDRAKVTTYTVRSADKKLTDKIKKSAKKLNADALKELYNKDNAILQSTEAIYEKGKNKELDDLKWKPGTVSNGYVKEGSFYFTKIESVNPATNKTLDEARGYIVADYQDELEKNLIKGLRESFKVEVKQDVFKGLIKKK